MLDFECTNDSNIPPLQDLPEFDQETWFEIVCVDQRRLNTALPDRFHGRFEYLGDALSAIYLSGMDMAYDLNVSPDAVEASDDHLSNYLAIDEVTRTTASSVTRTTVL